MPEAAPIAQPAHNEFEHAREQARSLMRHLDIMHEGTAATIHAITKDSHRLQVERSALLRTEIHVLEFMLAQRRAELAQVEARAAEMDRERDAEREFADQLGRVTEDTRAQLAALLADEKSAVTAGAKRALALKLIDVERSAKLSVDQLRREHSTDALVIDVPGNREGVMSPAPGPGPLTQEDVDAVRRAVEARDAGALRAVLAAYCDEAGVAVEAARASIACVTTTAGQPLLKRACTLASGACACIGEGGQDDAEASFAVVLLLITAGMPLCALLEVQADACVSPQLGARIHSALGGRAQYPPAVTLALTAERPHQQAQAARVRALRMHEFTPDRPLASQIALVRQAEMVFAASGAWTRPERDRRDALVSLLKMNGDKDAALVQVIAAVVLARTPAPVEAFSWALDTGHDEAARVLAAHMPPGAAQIDKYGISAKQWATAFGKEDLAAELHPLGALFEQAWQMESPFWAAEKGFAGLIRVQHRRGIDVDRKGTSDTSQWSPLHLAALHGRLRAVDALLDAGADTNIRDFWLQTPLHIAAQNGQTSCVQRLVKAAPHHLLTLSRDKYTPLDLARRAKKDVLFLDAATAAERNRSNRDA